MYRCLCFIVFLLFVTNCDGTAQQCRNDRGEPVDWFYIYKLPREKNHLNPLVRKGVAYMYLTPSKLRQGWIMSDMSIANPNSMLGRTLQPMYQSKNTMSVLYNDQPPANDSEPDILQNVAEMYTRRKKSQLKFSEPSVKKYKKFKLGDKYYDDYDLAEMCKMHSKLLKNRVEKGHTKGVIMGDKFTSLWLVHSVPRFPPIPDARGMNLTGYSYPVTGMKYGQTMLCMSVQTTTVNQIAKQLQYNDPLVVYSQIPTEYENELPTLVEVVHNKTVTTAPWYHIESFETLAGRKFLSFAKTAMFNDDLYSGLVAEVLQSDLLVESWTNGPGTLDSECNRNFQVRNIERLKFPLARMSFTSHHDHSKWTVAVAHKMHNSQDTKVADYWVCVGDINRALPQESRGGGTVCTSGPILWGNFAHLIEWYIYKPPAGVVHPSGQNFSFLSPDTDGRWVLAPMSITEEEVLRNTLMPNYKHSYKNRASRAIAIFESRSGASQSAARGILMAGPQLGFLLTHTMPGFPRKINSQPLFPREELKNGHLLACLTLDLSGLNKVARAIKQVAPNITFSHIPESLTHLLPNWDFDTTLPPFDLTRLRPSIYSLIPLNESYFVDDTVDSNDSGPLEAMLVARPPGVKSCIYSSFAARQLVMLNVYGQSRSSYLTTTCSDGYGVRNIDSICLKHQSSEGPGNSPVYYVPTNSGDSTWFAVSTAGHWQQRGSGPQQFWVCNSLVDKEDVSGVGGLLVCVQNYNLWVAFDNLKVTEPSCDSISGQ